MKIVILGSTGSIGESTLEVLRLSQKQGSKNFEVRALVAHSNSEALERQAREFKVPRTVLTSTEKSENAIKDLVTSPDVDIVVNAIVGFAAVKPTLWALEAGKRVALANKEALVTCGEFLVSAARKNNGMIIPVDSEHNALFQTLQGHPMKNVKKLWITGSGGPFRGKTRSELERATVSSAMRHPNWSMGPKITIDSATLMNKGLEFIEARWVFDIEPRKIEVIIHPQSVVHGLAEFNDGTMLAHLSTADMKAAISYALYYPERQNNAVKPLNLAEIGKLEFETVDNETFPCLNLAKEALDQGGVAPTILNAANEVAVDAFLNERISFLHIPELISQTLAQSPVRPKAEVQWEQIFAVDAWAREQTQENISKL